MAIATGKTNASRVTAGDRILVKPLESGALFVSQTKTGAGVSVARVTGKTFVPAGRGQARGTYTIHTTAGDIRGLNSIQTMWLAPEDAAGIKRAHVEALKEDQDRDHAEKVRAQLRTATTAALTDALTDASPSLAALIQVELDFRAERARELVQTTITEEELEAVPAEPARFTGEPEVTAEEALAAIGGCWAGGALTGKALKAYADGDYVLALAITVDQKKLQEKGGPDALHPEHAERVAQAEVLRGAAQEALAEDPMAEVRELAGAWTDLGSGVYVAPLGTPEPGPEDLADLALALAAEDLEHVDPDGEKPEPAQPRCEVGDVVTIHRGDRLYEVLQVERDSLWDRVSGTREELSMARVAPCDPEDHRDPQWVNVDLLHVRPPLGRYVTVEITERVRQTQEVFRLGEKLVAIRTILMDSRRVPVATLAAPPLSLAAPVATLRVGEAVVVDGRALQVVDPEGTGELKLEPARWRDRLPVS